SWGAMDHRSRGQFMAEVILPTLETSFREHDAERYKDFSCTTCHGISARDRNFQMPNPDLLALYPTGHSEQKRMVAENRAMATFMFQRVLPQVRDLLGQPEFNEQTGEGFSCFSCHPQGQAE
ncbi:MAG: hypothetical protein KC416_08700, partial [Myxococcales bacterium]|nr:hypothetical protein [Myxococcales bacterium]